MASYFPPTENLPIFNNNLEISQRDGKYYIKNMHFLRHILNEYRLLIYNKSDSIYYTKIHKFCSEKLLNKDISKDLSITVQHENHGDITDKFLKILSEKVRSVKSVLKNAEFSYLYNGILQHSDPKYTKRFWQEYSSGKLNYIFIKHAILLDYIQECLALHYKILNKLTFPRLGSL